MPMSSTPFPNDWIPTSEFLQDARRKLFIDNVDRQFSSLARSSLRHGMVLPSTQTKHLFIKLIWKAFRPGEQLFRDIAFEDFMQFFPITISLVACHFINEGNNADSGKSTHENIALDSNMILLFEQQIGITCG